MPGRGGFDFYRNTEDMILPGWAELTFIGEGLNFYRGGEDKQSSKLKVASQQILINFIINGVEIRE